jgi:hypothetical protein
MGVCSNEQNDYLIEVTPEVTLLFGYEEISIAGQALRIQ